MRRVRAWPALGLILGVAGCAGVDRRAATGPTAAAPQPPDILAQPSPEGLARFFPGLGHAPGFLPRSTAARFPEPAAPLDRSPGHGRAIPGPAPEETAPLLPVAIVAQTYPDPAAGPPATAAARGAIPRDESTRQAQASPEPTTADVATEPVPAVAPGASDRPTDGVRTEPLAADDPPARPQPAAAGVDVLAGRPRLPLVRPFHLPEDLPPPLFPPTYYGPEGPPRPAPAAAVTAATEPWPRTRRLLARLGRTAPRPPTPPKPPAPPAPKEPAQAPAAPSRWLGALRTRLAERHREPKATSAPPRAPSDNAPAPQPTRLTLEVVPAAEVPASYRPDTAPASAPDDANRTPEPPQRARPWRRPWRGIIPGRIRPWERPGPAEGFRDEVPGSLLWKPGDVAEGR